MPHDEIAIGKLLQSRGLRVTNQRLLILDAICDGGGHTTLREIIARVRRADDSIDQSTVHRTVNLMCEIGVVSATTVGGADTVYELVGETPHHHLSCTLCGKQEHLSHEALKIAFDRIRRECGFIVNAKHLILEGVCAACES
jgi:Fur family transcriptional regulator, ferric uptake regulator